MNDSSATTIPTGAFVAPENFHLKIGALSLLSPDRLDAASTLLKSLEKIVWSRVAIPERKTQAFTIDLVGLGDLSSSPSGFSICGPPLRTVTGAR